MDQTEPQFPIEQTDGAGEEGAPSKGRGHPLSANRILDACVGVAMAGLFRVSVADAWVRWQLAPSPNFIL